MAREQANHKVSNHDLHRVVFERSGQTFLTCGDDKTLRMFAGEFDLKKTLTGHEDSVLDCCYD